MTVQEAIQSRIDAQQKLDAIDYGIRTLGGYSDTAQAQHRAACEAAGPQCDGSEFALKWAREQARETLAAAKEQLRAIGTARQLRLAVQEAA